jgi:hypothetical protein
MPFLEQSLALSASPDHLFVDTSYGLGFQINHTLLFGPLIWPMIVLVAGPKLFLNPYSQHTLHLA